MFQRKEQSKKNTTDRSGNRSVANTIGKKCGGNQVMGFVDNRPTKSTLQFKSNKMSHKVRSYETEGNCKQLIANEMEITKSDLIARLRSTVYLFAEITSTSAAGNRKTPVYSSDHHGHAEENFLAGQGGGITAGDHVRIILSASPCSSEYCTTTKPDTADGCREILMRFAADNGCTIHIDADHLYSTHIEGETKLMGFRGSAHGAATNADPSVTTSVEHLPRGSKLDTDVVGTYPAGSDPLQLYRKH